MSRLRYRFASSEADQIIQSHLERASRELLKARDVVLSKEAQSFRRNSVQRDIDRALSSIVEVGSLERRFGADDPDLVSEAERNRLAREERRKRREEVTGG